MTIAPDAPKVAMLIYPGMVALDLIVPITVLTMLGCRVDLVWKNATPVATDVGIPFVVTRTFVDCPRDLDVLCVPSGIMGIIACMNDPAVRAFLAGRGAGRSGSLACARARWRWRRQGCSMAMMRRRIGW